MEREQMAAVYDRWKDTVYRVALTYCRNVHDAEDMTQETFLTRFTDGREFQSTEEEKAWLIRVVINKCKNLLRSAPRTRHVALEEIVPLCASPQEHDVLDAVCSLPENYRLVIHLYYFEGYDVREIAALTGRTETNVSTQLYRARKQLKRMLKEEF